MGEKYILTDECITIYSHEKNCYVKLYRIKATRSFGDVKEGDLGGFIESKNNLPQYWNCWVYDDAMVYENAKVHGNAKVRGNARVCNHAKVYDNAIVEDNALIATNAQVYENARVGDNAVVTGDTEVYGHAKLFGNGKAKGSVKLRAWDQVINDGIAEYESDRRKQYAIGGRDNHWYERRIPCDRTADDIYAELIFKIY